MHAYSLWDAHTRMGHNIGPYAYGISHTRMGRPIRVWDNIRIWGRTSTTLSRLLYSHCKKHKSLGVGVSNLRIKAAWASVTNVLTP